jgi:hypothetical protein
MNKPALLFVLCLIALLGWGAYEAGQEAEKEKPVNGSDTQQPSPSQKSQDSGGKDKEVAFGDMARMSDQLAISALIPLHMQKFMLDLCGITAADAPAAFAANKAEQEKYLSAISAKGKEALAGEYAKMEGPLRTGWDNSTAEQRAKGCADIKAQAIAEGAK